MPKGTRGSSPPKRAPAARKRSRDAYQERITAPLADPRPLLSVVEVAGYLGVSRWTIYRLIREGDLPAITVGKVIKVRPSALEAYLERGRVA